MEIDKRESAIIRARKAEERSAAEEQSKQEYEARQERELAEAAQKLRLLQQTEIERKAKILQEWEQEEADRSQEMINSSGTSLSTKIQIDANANFLHPIHSSSSIQKSEQRKDLPDAWGTRGSSENQTFDIQNSEESTAQINTQNERHNLLVGPRPLKSPVRSARLEMAIDSQPLMDNNLTEDDAWSNAEVPWAYQVIQNPDTTCSVI